ncbi:hypothetical protein M0805_009596 [Coniferiporia weirii]|nr:hypothetical protein M0805_009596 [Coniferiporia weirii]
MSNRPRSAKPLAPLQPPRHTRNNNEKYERNELNARLRVPGVGADDNLRWSEVVPPDTALTFAAMWDPEEGLVTFEGAALSACNSSEKQARVLAPKDTDGRSQELTIDLIGIGSSPSTARDSVLYPYSRFAASELSMTHLAMAATTRPNSAGTGGFLDTFMRSQLQLQAQAQVRPHALPNHLPSPHPHPLRNEMRSPGSDAPSQKTKVKTPALGTPFSLRFKHRHTSSQDSGLSGRLGQIGSGLCQAFHRDTARDTARDAGRNRAFTRADRYGFLRRTATKAKEGGCGEGRACAPGASQLAYDSDGGVSPCPKSGGLRSMFANSTWNRSEGETLQVGFRTRFASPDIINDHGAPLDPVPSHAVSGEEMNDAWLGYFDDGLDLDLALKRDVRRLKSTFSWTTTSTSRYIDVAKALREIDMDSDSSNSHTASPCSSDAAPHTSQESHSGYGGTLADADSEWLPVEPPTPFPAGANPRPGAHRKLVKKSSKVYVAGVRASLPSQQRTPSPTHTAQTCSQCRVCPHCYQCVDSVDVGCESMCSYVFADAQGKGKGRERSRSQSQSHSGSGSGSESIGFGRPGVTRSCSSPASFQSSSGKAGPRSKIATPEEVLARASYNHEWAFPPKPHSLSSLRSDLPFATAGTSAVRASLETPPSVKKECQHMSDVRDVLRGMQSAIRSSTPVPGMPLAQRHHRTQAASPPPTSFRPGPLSVNCETPVVRARHRRRSSTPPPPPPSSFSPPSQLPKMSTQSKSKVRAGSRTSIVPNLKRARSHGSFALHVQTPALVRSRSLQSLSSAMHGLATSSAAPLRVLLAPSSLLRRSFASAAGARSGAGPGAKDEDGVWVRVDLKKKRSVGFDSGIHVGGSISQARRALNVTV